MPPPPLKQSMLSFNSPKKTSKPSTADAIVIGDSDDDDGLHTPPPPSVKPAKKSNGVVVELFIPPSKPKVLKSAASGSSTEKAKEPTKKKASKKKSLTSDAIPSSSSQDITKDAVKKARTSVGESVLCHQHRSACSTLLRCTRLRADGNRCPYKYCYPSLHRSYKQDAEQIVSAGRNILGVDVKEHVGPEVANYLWKCPRCRGGCQCSMCRKQLGLEPLGPTRPSKKAAGQGAGGQSAVASTSKRAAGDDVDGEKKIKKAAIAPEMDVDLTLTQHSGALASTISQPMAQSQPLQMSEQAGPESLHQSESAAVQSQAGSSHFAPETLFNAPAKQKAPLQQQTFQTPLRKPKAVDLPQLTRIETRLPVANIMERVWLYESLIRFDSFKIPKTVLSHLDRFDDWTEIQVQTILERLICSIADISSIKTTPPRSIHKGLVEAFRSTGDDLNRGEAWEAAREYCLTKEARMVELENVEPLPHQKGRDRKTKESRWNTDETLLGGRQTRSRRLAETQAMARVKAMSIREMESSEESSESEDSTVETSIEEGSDEEVPKGPRRSRRGMQRSARQRDKKVKRASISDSEDESMDVEVVERERSESVVEVVQEAQPSRPVSAPPFEQRVAVLSSLVDVLMKSKQVNEEISFGFKQAVELEKAGKEEEKEILRKQEEELKEIDRRAPSMTVVEEFCQWKEDKHKLMKEHAFAFLDLRIHTHLQIELHKSRCEPIGFDCDGNEYWHLSEYVETKPQDTTRRWAWQLLVLGTTFCKDEKVEQQSSTALQPIEITSSRVSGNSTPKDDKGTPFDDGIMVLIEVPLHKTTGRLEKARKEKTKTPEVQFRNRTSRSVTAEDKQPSRLFSGTDNHGAIAQLTEYIRYRLLVLEFEEQQEFRQKTQAEELRAREAFEANTLPAFQTSTTIDNITPIVQEGNSKGNMLLASDERRSNVEKVNLKERQKDRRSQVEALLKKLDMVRDYYKWHEQEDD